MNTFNFVRSRRKTKAYQGPVPVKRLNSQPWINGKRCDDTILSYLHIGQSDCRYMCRRVLSFGLILVTEPSFPERQETRLYNLSVLYDIIYLCNWKFHTQETLKRILEASFIFLSFKLIQ